MDNIIQRLSRQPEGRPETFKKFNPNPPPEFPSYEQWVQQAQTAEKQEVQRPPEFPSYEDWQSQVAGGTLPSHFQMETPTELPTEVPGEIPTETGIPDEFQKLMDFLGLTEPKELVDVIGEATDKDLITLFKLAGVKEEEPIEEELKFPTTKKEAGQMILNKTITKTQLESFALLGLVPKEWVEEPEADIQSEITKAIEDGAIYDEIWDFLTNKETGLGLSNSDASKEIEIWVKANQDIPTIRE